jgi:hypothetical protein
MDFSLLSQSGSRTGRIGEGRGIIRFLALFLSLSVTARAEVYLSKDQALESVFGKACTPRYEPRDITSQLKERLQKQGLWGIDHEQAHFFSCAQGNGTRSFALIDEEVGKHLPITYIVGISDRGTVTRVEMMVFREIRGWEARERRFMRQFEGKELKDELAVGKSLANVTGATLSSRAVAKGVKRALALWRFYYDHRVTAPEK